MAFIQNKQTTSLVGPQAYGGLNPKYAYYKGKAAMVPNVENDPGIRPDSYIVAPYLKLLRYDDSKRCWVSLGSHKVVCLDSNGFLVHAGLLRQCESLIDTSEVSGAISASTDPSGIVLDRYTSNDIANGVKNSRGKTAISNEPVAWSLLTATVYDGVATVDFSAVANPINPPLGVSCFQGFATNGVADGYNGYDPTKARFWNNIPQTSVTLLCDYVLQLPIEPYTRTQKSFLARDFGGSPDASLADIVQDLNGTGSSVVAVTLTLTGMTTTIQNSFKVLKNGKRLKAKTSALVTGDEDIYYVWNNASPDTLSVLAKEADEFRVEFLQQTASSYSTPFPGLTTFRERGTTVLPGQMVTFDYEGNFIVDPEVSYSSNRLTDGLFNAMNVASADYADRANLGPLLASEMNLMKRKKDQVLGQVIRVDYDYPKDSLNKVRTAFDPNMQGALVDPETGVEQVLDRMPGSATGGIPYNIYLAGGDTESGTVLINLITR